MCDTLPTAFVGFCENFNIPSQIKLWKVSLYMEETPKIKLEHFSHVLNLFKRTNTVNNDLHFYIKSKSSHLKYYLFFLAANTEGYEEMEVKCNEEFGNYKGKFETDQTDSEFWISLK